MKHLAAILVVSVLALSARAEVWQFGDFELRWLDAWKRDGEAPMIRLLALPPDRAAVTIDLMDREAPHELPTSYARKELPKLAARHGKIIEALKEEALPSGATLFSIVCYDSKKDHFGIIFVHVSPKGRLAQLAVEGFGDPKPLVSGYRDLALTSRWRKEPNQPPEPTR